MHYIRIIATTYMIYILILYLVSMTKCDTAVLRGSCECAHDKLTDRDVKLTINGLSGASGTSFYTYGQKNTSHI